MIKPLIGGMHYQGQNLRMVLPFGHTQFPLHPILPALLAKINLGDSPPPPDDQEGLALNSGNLLILNSGNGIGLNQDL